MKQTSTIISVPNPATIDSGILDTMFGSSQAISDAVSEFWGLNLAARAELGTVTTTLNGYDVEIKYRARQ